MAKSSPLQRVQDEHGSKKKLAQKVLNFLDAADGESKEDFEQRIGTLSNQKLLRMFDANSKLTSKFENRDALIAKLVAVKFPNGNTDYGTKLGTYTTPKLMDLARQYKV